MIQTDRCLAFQVEEEGGRRTTTNDKMIAHVIVVNGHMNAGSQQRCRRYLSFG